MLRVGFWIGVVAGAACQAQDNPCTSTSLRNGSTAAYEILQKVADKAPFDRASFYLYESQATVVKGRAVSRLCNGTQKWILYDPEYIDGIRQRAAGSDVPLEFVLAHEAAHHQLDHTALVGGDWNTGYWGPKQEIDADRTAAMWLTRLGVKRDALLQAFDALQLPEQADPKAGYPSRADRRTAVIKGYEVESAGTLVSSPTNETGATRPEGNAQKSAAAASALRDLTGEWEVPVQDGIVVRVVRAGSGYVATVIGQGSDGRIYGTGATLGKKVFSLGRRRGTLTEDRSQSTGKLMQQWSYEYEATLFYYTGGRCSEVPIKGLTAKVTSSPGFGSRFITFSSIPNYAISYNTHTKHCDVAPLGSSGLDLFLAARNGFRVH